MDRLDLESDLDQRDSKPKPFLGIVHVDDIDECSDDSVNEAGVNEAAASIQNPNKDDTRRLFQIYRMQFEWDSNIPYSEQPNRLEQEGPIPLLFPDHFLGVQGGISLIYWEEDKSNPCLATIKDVEEEDETFTFHIFSWQRKQKKTFYDTGKTMIAKQSLVWRLVWRKEFEMKKKSQDIRKGQIIRVFLQGQLTDFTGYVKNMKGNLVTVVETAGRNEGQMREFNLSEVINVVEILSSPLFFRFRRTVAGEDIKNGKNLVWEAEATEEIVKESSSEDVEKPRMLLSAPRGCKYKRS